MIDSSKQISAECLNPEDHRAKIGTRIKLDQLNSLARERDADDEIN